MTDSSDGRYRATVQRLLGLVGAVRVLAGGALRTRGALVFAYHDVADVVGPAQQYSVTPRRLRAHLNMALRWGLRFVSLSELTTAVERGESADGMAAVVFDDSLVGVHHHAMSILLELGVPATVFAVTGALGCQPPWWPGSQRVMTVAELAEMAEAGFEVACHTHSHPALPGLSDASLAQELEGPRARLQDVSGAAVDLLAYPFGAHDGRVRAAVASSGYRAAYTFLNGRITPGLDRYRLPRLNMTEDQHRLRFAYHLARPPASWPETQVEKAEHKPVGA